MLILASSSKIGFEFSLGQPSQEVLDGLVENFIKDRYGPTLIGEHIDFLDETIERHLAI